LTFVDVDDARSDIPPMLSFVSVLLGGGGTDCIGTVLPPEAEAPPFIIPCVVFAVLKLDLAWEKFGSV